MKKVLFILVMIVMLTVFFIPVALAADGSAANIPVDFWAYITQESYVLIPVLYLIGYALKKIPKIPDWVIPFGLLIISIPVAMALSGWTIQGAIQGALVTGVTVLGNQLYKQGAKKSKNPKAGDTAG